MADATTVAEHEHHWDAAPVGAVPFCAEPGCTEMRVRTADGWRKLTPKEQTDATIIMWEDILIVDAMKIIHGNLNGAGLAHARRMLGYGVSGSDRSNND